MTAQPEAGPGRIGVFLVSSNRLLREALSRFLRKKEDLEIFGETFFSADVFAEIGEKPIHVLLLDDSPEEFAGRPVLVDLLERSPSLKVILLGMPEDEKTFLRSVRHGAAGYLLQDASAADVVAAVRAVARNEAVCPPRLCGTLFQHTARQAAGPSVRIRVQLGLTRRQQQLVPLISRGLTNKEIAALLNLSEQTIKNHIHRMLRRVGAGDRLGVVELCRDQGHLV